jgi:hypothetical protein
LDPAPKAVLDHRGCRLVRVRAPSGCSERYRLAFSIDSRMWSLGIDTTPLEGRVFICARPTKGSGAGRFSDAWDSKHVICSPGVTQCLQMRSWRARGRLRQRGCHLAVPRYVDAGQHSAHRTPAHPGGTEPGHCITVRRVARSVAVTRHGPCASRPESPSSDLRDRRLSRMSVGHRAGRSETDIAKWAMVPAAASVYRSSAFTLMLSSLSHDSW